MTPASAPSLMEAAPQEEALGVGALGRAADVGALGRTDSSSLGSFSLVGGRSKCVVANTSSPFYVDPGVTELAPPHQLLEKLHKLQKDGKKGPFPTGACRNYNVFAAGYQREIGDWVEDHKWGPVRCELPPHFDKVLVRIQRLSEETDSPAWTWGVMMLKKLLENLKARAWNV